MALFQPYLPAVRPRKSTKPHPPSNAARQCLALPPGFCATVFADKIGHVRHIGAGPDGILYANSAPDREDDTVPSGLVVLQDVDGDGKSERFQRPFPGQIGGTGLAVFRNRVFLESGNRIISYSLSGTRRDPSGTEQVVVAGLPTDRDHFSHSIAIRADGALFVTSGSATNACQAENRKAGSPGQTPCAEKALRAGIWRFDAGKTDQRFSPRERFASGIRNAVGITLDGSGRIFATQHGRDQLHENSSDSRDGYLVPNSVQTQNIADRWRSPKCPRPAQPRGQVPV